MTRGLKFEARGQKTDTGEEIIIDHFAVSLVSFVCPVSPVLGEDR